MNQDDQGSFYFSAIIRVDVFVLKCLHITNLERIFIVAGGSISITLVILSMA